ncbi:MAG TPA: dihydropteroate synthase [Planctomycetaceae bacterium]|nr:dihydropteroate synthase [Planctomycetaceae bacterium]
MGIVNVTPDSFSDGGQFDNAAAAVDHALQLADDGATILDIGGESTRPYAAEVSTPEELNRVIPVIELLAKQTTVPISIDTSSAAVARAAIDAGAEIINDVTGLTNDSEMPGVAASTNVGVCVMHMQGTPQTMQDDPQYDDVITEIHEYLQGRLDQLIEQGIEQSRICLDPGIGFGKSHQHNLQLLKSCHQFHALGAPLLVGHSRKGFIAHVLNDRECERTSGTIGTSIALALQGVQILRVHDVAEVQRALTMFFESTAEI